jgi:hypothetical protein
MVDWKNGLGEANWHWRSVPLLAVYGVEIK